MSIETLTLTQTSAFLSAPLPLTHLQTETVRSELERDCDNFGKFSNARHRPVTNPPDSPRALLTTMYRRIAFRVSLVVRL
jgi:hypothetical protein